MAPIWLSMPRSRSPNWLSRMQPFSASVASSTQLELLHVLEHRRAASARCSTQEAVQHRPDADADLLAIERVAHGLADHAEPVLGVLGELALHDLARDPERQRQQLALVALEQTGAEALQLVERLARRPRRRRRARAAAARPAATPSAYAASAACCASSTRRRRVRRLAGRRASAAARRRVAAAEIAEDARAADARRRARPGRAARAARSRGVAEQRGFSVSNEDIVRASARDHELAVGLEVAHGGDDALLRRLDVLQAHRPRRAQVLAQDLGGAARDVGEDLLGERRARGLEREQQILARAPPSAASACCDCRTAGSPRR